MKTLELNQMENLQGGVSCEGGAGLATGWIIGASVLAIATGGAVPALALLGSTMFPSFIAAAVNCSTEN